ASRTVPFISKAVGVPLAKIATQVMLGRTLKELGINDDLDLQLKTFNIKMPVFPFHKFPGSDVLLGPEMKSTGEVMGRARDFSLAYAKALCGSGAKVPTHGTAFLSVADIDKPALLEIAKKLQNMGFRLEATSGTRDFLEKNGLRSEMVNKYGNGSPNCVEGIAANKYQFVINTAYNEQSVLDSYTIRRTALEKKVPYCTLITTARAFLRAIESAQNNPIATSVAPITEP
ncbi:MAG TPA: carbamoyl phosphate synthase large subunit, partial [Oligoflexia bacterium]|nr:carbamoyl phosphate synthase large subunit [Oligoflexia bacterium]